MNTTQEHCPLCRSTAIPLAYGKTTGGISHEIGSGEKYFGGCLVFPDENGIVPDRVCPDCKHEWASSYQTR
ncbi:hypothetical protein LJC19_03035 [Oxalobacter sp. OttesenSCG-928-P03]|nr:hypothetical protein [Oxalobacter sp. OttesenSCG-928-P03]